MGIDDLLYEAFGSSPVTEIEEEEIAEPKPTTSKTNNVNRLLEEAFGALPPVETGKHPKIEEAKPPSVELPPPEEITPSPVETPQPEVPEVPTTPTEAPKGNIDLTNRPTIKNEDRTLSTIGSISINENGKEILIPTVREGLDRLMSDQEAIDWYHKTGEYLGKFNTVDEATKYAQQLSESQQARLYSGKPEPVPSTEVKPSDIEEKYVPSPTPSYGAFGVPMAPPRSKSEKMGLPEAMARSFAGGAADLAINFARTPQTAAEIYLALNNYTNRALNYGIKKITGKEKGPLPEIPLESIPDIIKLNENAWDTKTVRKFSESQKEAIKEATNTKGVVDNLTAGNFSEAGKSLGIQAAAQVPLILSMIAGGAVGASAKALGGFAGATQSASDMDQYWKDVEAGVAKQTPEKAAVNALLNGAFEMIGESKVTGNIIEDAMKVITKKTSEDVAKKAVGNAVGAVVGKMLKSAGSEMTEEAFVNYSQAVMDKLFGKRDVTLQQAIKEGIEGGIVGFFTSAATTGPLSGIAESQRQRGVESREQGPITEIVDEETGEVTPIFEKPPSPPRAPEGPLTEIIDEETGEVRPLGEGPIEYGTLADYGMDIEEFNRQSKADQENILQALSPEEQQRILSGEMVAEEAPTKSIEEIEQEAKESIQTEPEIQEQAEKEISPFQKPKEEEEAYIPVKEKVTEAPVETENIKALKEKIPAAKTAAELQPIIDGMTVSEINRVIGKLPEVDLSNISQEEADEIIRKTRENITKEKIGKAQIAGTKYDIQKGNDIANQIEGLTFQRVIPGETTKKGKVNPPKFEFNDPVSNTTFNVNANTATVKSVKAALTKKRKQPKPKEAKGGLQRETEAKIEEIAELPRVETVTEPVTKQPVLAKKEEQKPIPKKPIPEPIQKEMPSAKETGKTVRETGRKEGPIRGEEGRIRVRDYEKGGLEAKTGKEIKTPKGVTAEVSTIPKKSNLNNEKVYEPVLNLDKKSTGWIRPKNNKSVLIDPESRKQVVFKAEKPEAATAKAKTNTAASGYAINNPIKEMKREPTGKVSREAPVSPSKLTEGKAPEAKEEKKKVEPKEKPKFAKGKEETPVKAKPFYSPLLKATQNMKQDKFSAEQLKKVPGVKKAEWDWIGMDDFFKGKKSATKAEVEQFIAENQTEIEEVRKGVPLDWKTSPSEAATKDKIGNLWEVKKDHNEYTIYKNGEVATYVDKPETQKDAMDAVESLIGISTKFSEWVEPGGENYREILITLPEVTDTYREGHYAQTPNVIAHFRVNDREVNGEKVLFIEEIQSDWSKAARKAKDLGVQGPAYQPFLKNWEELTLKRILRMAAEEGYDRVAWITGEQTARRYDLSKKVNRVTWQPEDMFLRGFQDNTQVFAKLLESPNEIQNYIGKEPAKKILGQEPTTDELTGLPIQITGGDDLKIGGEWAKNLYDKMIPQFLSKYGKKWGAKIEDINLGFPSDKRYVIEDILDSDTYVVTDSKTGKIVSEGRLYKDEAEALEKELNEKEGYTTEDNQSIPVTDAMKKSVLEEGQPLFAKKEEALPVTVDKKKVTPQEKELTDIVYSSVGKDPKYGSIQIVENISPDSEIGAIGKTIEETTDKKVVFIKTDDRSLKPTLGFTVDGLSLPGATEGTFKDTIFINVDSTRPLMWTAYHEFAHFLDTNPNYNKRFWDAVKLTDKGMAELAKEGQSELTADIIGEMMSRQDFWENLTKRNRTTAQKIMQEFLRIVNKIRNSIRKIIGSNEIAEDQIPQYVELLNDVTAARDALAQIYSDYKKRTEKDAGNIPTEMAAAIKKGKVKFAVNAQQEEIMADISEEEAKRWLSHRWAKVEKERGKWIAKIKDYELLEEFEYKADAWDALIAYAKVSLANVKINKMADMQQKLKFAKGKKKKLPVRKEPLNPLKKIKQKKITDYKNVPADALEFKRKAEAQNEDAKKASNKSIKERLKSVKYFIGQMVWDRVYYAKQMLGNTPAAKAVIGKINSIKGFSNKAKIQYEKAVLNITKNLPYELEDEFQTYIMAKRISEIEKLKGEGKVKHPKGMTETEADSYIDFVENKINKKDSLAIKIAASRYWRAMHDQLDQAHENGIISDKLYDRLSKEGRYYSPRRFIQHIDPSKPVTSPSGKKVSVRESGIKALEKGSEEAMENNWRLLLSETVASTQSRIFKNNAVKALADFVKNNPDNLFDGKIEQPAGREMDLIDFEGIVDNLQKERVKLQGSLAKATTGAQLFDIENKIDEIIEKIDRWEERIQKAKSKGEEKVFIEYKKQPELPRGMERLYYREDGESKAILVSKEFAESWNNNDVAINHTLAQFLNFSFGGALVRPFATGVFAPEFALSNIPRDMALQWIATQEYSRIAPVALVQNLDNFRRVFNDAWHGTGRYEDYVNEGGGMEFLNEGGTFFRKDPTKALAPLSTRYTRFVDVLRHFQEFSERLSRLALREQAIKNGKTPEEATQIAREYLDFSQGGELVKGLDNAIPYLNASVQGARGLVRAAVTEKSSTALKAGQLLMMGAALAMIATKFRRKEWDEISDREKVNRWNFPLWFSFKNDLGEEQHVYFSIPKDQSSRIFATFGETVTELRQGSIDWETAWKRMKMAFDDMSPIDALGMLPPMMSAIIGYSRNENFWKEEKIWKGRENISPYMEYYEGRTPKAYIDLSEKLYDIGVDLSPERMHQSLQQVLPKSLLSSFMGGTYEAVTAALSKEDKQELDKKIFQHWTQIPGIRKYIRATYPSKTDQEKLAEKLIDYGIPLTNKKGQLKSEATLKHEIKKEERRRNDIRQQHDNELAIVSELFQSGKGLNQEKIVQILTDAKDELGAKEVLRIGNKLIKHFHKNKDSEYFEKNKEKIELIIEVVKEYREKNALENEKKIK